MQELNADELKTLINQFTETNEDPVTLKHGIFVGEFSKIDDSNYIYKTESNNFLVAQATKKLNIQNLYYVPRDVNGDLTLSKSNKVYINPTLTNFFSDLNKDI